jgi:hypothetical protein
MPTENDQKASERAREAQREGKAPSTQASEFVREEIEHVREGRHGARSPQQAIAIGLSKARRAGVNLPPPRQGSSRIRRQAERDLQKGRSGRSHRVSGRRSRAAENALRREGSRSVSRGSLSRQARQSARRRGSSARRQAARKAVRTKGPMGLREAARKAARTRHRHAA